MRAIPRTPAGLKRSGARLWRDVLRNFELDRREMTILDNACRVADLCDALQAAVDTAGPVREDGAVSPALVELRQQRLLLSRYLAQLAPPRESSREGGRTPKQPTGSSWGVA